jgi:hypothetical protein
MATEIETNEPTTEPTAPTFEPMQFSEARTLQDQGDGRNAHQILSDAALRKCGINALPPPLQKARVELDRAEAARAEADAKLNEASRVHSAWQELQNLANGLRDDVAAGTEQLDLCRKSLGDLTRPLDSWRTLETNGPRGELSRVLDMVLRTERMAAFLPGWIASRKAKLAEAEKQLAAFERANKIAQ